MGRRAMTAEQQEARGNPGHRPARQRTTLTAQVLTRPDWLTNEVAQQVWDKLGADEGSLYFLRQTDLNAFARYCTYMANWIEADEKLTALGSPVYETQSAHGNMLRVHPLSVVRSRLEDDLTKLESELGLNPSARLRIVQQLAARGAQGGLFDKPAAAQTEATDEVSPAPPDADDMDAIGGLNSRLN